jgi:hypothetical protein
MAFLAGLKIRAGMMFPLDDSQLADFQQPQQFFDATPFCLQRPQSLAISPHTKGHVGV